MSSLRITTFLLAAAAFQISAGAPQKRETFGPTGTATLGSFAEEDEGSRCVSCVHPYCRTFNPSYTHSSLPNPRQGSLEDIKNHDGPDATYCSNAIKEFEQFIPLLNTHCSDKLGTLLCFFYFPFCNSLGVNIRPCESLCDEVCRNCSDALEDIFAQAGFPGLGWEDLRQFNCSNEINGEKVFNEKKDQCANNTQAPWIPGIFGPTIPRPTSPTTPKPEKPATTAKIPKEITDEEDDFATTEETLKTASTTTTTAPIEEVTCPPYTGKCPNCRIRRGVNGKTFVRNPEYNFAFRATLNSFGTHDCKWALNLTVHETYGAKSEDCSTAPEITASTVAGLGSNTACNNCFIETPKLNLVAGEEYLVAGVVGQDGVWELAGTHSLIVRFDEETPKTIAKGIKNGNAKKRCS